MKLSHYIKRVEDSEEYKKFREKHKKAYLSAGFFVLDYEAGKHMHQIDFFIPGSKKLATFKLEQGVSLQVMNIPSRMKTPEKIEGESNLDIDALRGIVHDEMLNRTVTQDVKKIIAILQQEKGRKIWKLNCITGDLGIIKVYIDDAKGDVLEFEKASLFDMMKIVKPSDIKQLAVKQASVTDDDAKPASVIVKKEEKK